MSVQTFSETSNLTGSGLGSKLSQKYCFQIANGLSKGLHCWESIFEIWGTFQEALTRNSSMITPFILQELAQIKYALKLLQQNPLGIVRKHHSKDIWPHTKFQKLVKNPKMTTPMSIFGQSSREPEDLESTLLGAPLMIFNLSKSHPAYYRI